MGNIHSFLTANQVAAQWACHRTTVVRICRRYGISGVKFGPSKQAARRFRATDIHKVEQLASIINGGSAS